MAKVKQEEEAVVRTKQSYIFLCNCTKNSFGKTNGAEFQDATLGKGNRYYTDGGPASKNGKQRCTVCGRERTRS